MQLLIGLGSQKDITFVYVSVVMAASSLPKLTQR